MKFLKPHNIKYSSKLFQNKYKFKVVFTSGVAGWFRGSNVDKIQYLYENSNQYYYSRQATVGEKNHAFKLSYFLKSIDDWQSRVESPYVSIYLNTLKDLETVVKNCKNRIKYVEIPDPSTATKLIVGTILVKKLDFDFKVTVGNSYQSYSSFVKWSTNNSKIRLPKRAARDLCKDHSFGGGYFYVKDEKSLTMVKMFLGSTITKIEKVIKA